MQPDLYYVNKLNVISLPSAIFFTFEIAHNIFLVVFFNNLNLLKNYKR